ncbi:hypothetical protein [Paraclostridium sordellii]|nr:hypothetical protein [Paeniclostridium sordellii]
MSNSSFKKVIEAQFDCLSKKVIYCPISWICLTNQNLKRKIT